eukprot:gene13009-9306_t
MGSGVDPHRWLHELLSLQQNNPEAVDSGTVDKLITSFGFTILSSPSTETIGHEVASFLSGLARLGVPWSALATRRLLCILIDQAIASAFPNELSVIVHSLGELRVNQAQDLPSTLTASLLDRLSSALTLASPRVLSCTLWGLKECRFRWKQFPVALRQHIVCAVVAFNGQESRQATANSLLALAQLGVRYTTDLTMSQQAALQTQWQRLPQRSMAFVDMVQILHALGAMQCPWSSLHPDTQFALGEAWFAAVQREIHRANSDAVASIVPSTVGLVLHQLAQMNATWTTLPSAFKAGLQLAVIYASSSSGGGGASGGPAAATTRSVATIVHSLARLGVSWSQLHEQAQRSLFRVLLLGGGGSSDGDDGRGRPPPLLRGRSLAACLVGFAELQLSWDRDLPVDVQQELWASLLHYAATVTATATVVTPTATQLTTRRELLLSVGEATSTLPPHENALQVLFTSLNALLQLQFPFATLQQRHSQVLEALLTSALTQATTSSTAALRDLIVGGWTLVQLGRRQLWSDAAATAAADGRRRRETLLPTALQAAYLRALARQLQVTAALSGDQHALMHHLLHEQRLAVDELVLLLKVLGNLRVSLREQAACAIAPPATRSGGSSSSLLAVTKSIAALIFASDRHATLTDVVLTLDALANMGHTWAGMPPSLRRKILAAYPRHTWNRGSLTCLFVWSLGRLRYPWHGSGSGSGSDPAALRWQRRLLDDVHAALTAGAVTNARSWASLLRGLAALRLCLPTATVAEEDAATASSTAAAAWTPLPIDLSRTLVQRLWQATVAPGDGHVDEDIEGDADHDGGLSRGCLWQADAASLRHVTRAWLTLSGAAPTFSHAVDDGGCYSGHDAHRGDADVLDPASSLQCLRSGLHRAWLALAQPPPLCPDAG